MTAHPMLVFSRPDQDRAGVAAWVREAVDAGERVMVRVAPAVTDVAALSADLSRTAAARPGQVAFLDAAELGAATGGRPSALRRAYVELVRQARRAGYAGLAVTGDGPSLRASARDDIETHERDLDGLTRELPLRVLCRYDSAERPDLLAGMAGVHHRATTDVGWDARLVLGCLRVHGEIDISNADRLATVLHAARLEGTRCVDLSGLGFCAAVGLGVLAEAAAHSPPGRPLVLRNPGPPLTRLLRLVWPDGDGDGVRIEWDGDA